MSDGPCPSPPVLEVAGLRVAFVQYERGLRRRTVHALTGMDLTAAAGEVVALVGGCRLVSLVGPGGVPLTEVRFALSKLVL